MASKRDVEPPDPVLFVKLPRLEQDPSASFPTGRGKPGSKTHFNYKGSYFACPLQSPNGPEPPHVRQSPEHPNLHYSTGAGSQPVLVEGPGECCPLNPTESMGPGLQLPPGAEMGRDRLMPEPVVAREKWGSTGPGHPFLVNYPAAVSRACTLAAPKPMYRAPAYFTDPRVAQPLQQRPGNADWALPAASHPFHPMEHRRGPHADPSLPSLHPLMALPTKEKMGSPAAFSPYYAAFEQYRNPPTSPFLDAGPHSQRKVPETHRLSPDPWHKLCPPATSPVYQERPPECYPSLHKAPLFLAPPAPHMEAQPCAYRGFGSEGSRVPYCDTYLKPQAPWRYFPSPSDTYVPRAASTSVVASPPPNPAALPRDEEPSRQEGYVPSSSFAFSPGVTAASSTSRACTEPGCKQHQAEGPRWPVVGRHSITLQPVCTQENVPGASCGIPEAFPKGEGCLRRRKPANPKRRVSLAHQETPHEGPRALITIGEGDTCKVKDAAEDLISPSPPASLPAGPEDPRDSEVPPPSPPMPVINKVFSLASYGDDVEGTEGSATFCREHLWGDTAPLSMGGRREPIVAVPTTASQALVHSVVVQSQGESGHRRVPEKPEPVPQELGAEGDSSEGEALDLSLKKRAVGPGGSPWVLDGEGGKEEEEDAEGKVGVGEGTKLQVEPFLLRVFKWEKSSIQSSNSFIVRKYKILCPPSAVTSTTPAPSSTTPAPSSTTPALSSTTPPPSSTILPSSTTPAPPSTTPAPSSTTPALSSTTPAPSSTILPSSTTPAPSSTILPSSTTPAPSSTILPSSTTPAPSSTTPTLSSTIPAPSSTILPSSTTPAPSSTTLPSSTTPAPSSTTPALSSTIPTLSSTIPSLSSIIPSPFSAIPALYSTIPALSSTIPAPPSTIPALSSTIPALYRTIPALSSTISALSSAIPAPSSTIPALSSTIPALYRTIPALSSTIPALSSTIPTLSSTIPALSIITAMQSSSTTPALSSAIPALSIITAMKPSSTTPAPPSTIPALCSTTPAPSSTIPSPSTTIPALSSTTPSPPSTVPAPPRSPQRSPAELRRSSSAASPQPGPQLGPLVLPEPPCAAPGEERPSLPSAGQYFASLHACLCELLSCSAARSSPQLLREWLKKAEAAEEQGEAMPKSPLKAKNDSRVPAHRKAAKGKEIWLAFQDVPALLAKLLSQLETFMFTCKCPFPHVVRAGAVFIPIHVVKKKLFPKLPGVSVDQVLQEHKVELRPTTLSEERHLRDLELKGCTSRMLKLLALKQLPEIYLDLLNLHWHNSIKQQLSSRSKAGKNSSK